MARSRRLLYFRGLSMKKRLARDEYHYQGEASLPTFGFG